MRFSSRLAPLYSRLKPLTSAVTPQAISWAVNLVLPPECPWCLDPIDDDQRLCDRCRAALEPVGSCCRRCALPLPAVVDNSSCTRCRDQGWRFERVVALGPYRGRLREAIILMKKPVYESLTMAAGLILADRLRAEQIEADLVLPVPNHWTRRIMHRTSAAETLATAIAAQLNVPLSLSLARRVKRTRKQGMLAWSNRQQNVKHAFHVRKQNRLGGKRVLVVDDVFTSGATAAELTRSLLKAGAGQVIIAVAARGTGRADPAVGG